MFDLASHSPVRCTWENVSSGFLNPFTNPLSPSPCPVDAGFPIWYSRHIFLDLDPGRLCFGWAVVLCWHLRQEFPGKIVKRFFWCCWQGSKGFRVLFSLRMGRAKGREGKRNRRTLLSDCISSEACTKRAEMWSDDWILFLNPLSLLPSYYDSSDFGWVF